MNYKKTNLSDMKKIGSKIKQIRTEKTNMTQRELSIKAGITSKAISEIESGNTKDIMGSTLDAICKALDTKIENILY